MAGLAEPEDAPDTGLSARCSDIRDTCIVGDAIRRGVNPAIAVAEALEERLYRGFRPSLKPLSRAEASAEILAVHCDAHRARATTLLTAISPGTGFPRSQPTPPPPRRAASR